MQPASHPGHIAIEATFLSAWAPPTVGMACAETGIGRNGTMAAMLRQQTSCRIATVPPLVSLQEIRTRISELQRQADTAETEAERFALEAEVVLLNKLYESKLATEQPADRNE